jgi:membrane fusion protein (multidrug efflux system)
MAYDTNSNTATVALKAEGVATPAKAEPNTRKTILLGVAGVAVLIAVFYIVKTMLFSFHHEETDNAQVDGHLYPVLPRVSGQVVDVLVTDNQKVAAGDVLLRIDPSDYKIKRDIAAAALENAKAALAVSQANVSVAKSNVGVVEANRAKVALDLERSTNLRKQDVIPQSEFDAVKANAQAISSQYASSENQYKSTLSQITLAQAQVAQRQAELDNADLQLSYTTVKAPEAGIVSKKNVEPGQFVQTGQPLLSLVGNEDVWVTANFKETQLKKMKVGQEVSVEVDAYPNVEFHGKIESIASATGAKFALLPPDNASGNFVKVVQRIPVKIIITDKPDPAHPLRVGMNVIATVTTD